MAGSRADAHARPSGTPRTRRPPIGVVVALQARIDREALVALLRTQADLAVLGTAAGLGEALEQCVVHRPSVLVLGTLVAGTDGVPATAVVRLAVPWTQVVVIAPHGEDRCALLNPTGEGVPACCPAVADDHRTCVELALAHGALGALRRDASADELFAAVRAAAEGRTWIAPGLTPRPMRGDVLTEQESRIARRVGEGESNKEIAAALRISELTVKKHVGHVLRKLGLHDRLQLGLCVARHPLAFRGK